MSVLVKSLYIGTYKNITFSDIFFGYKKSASCTRRLKVISSQLFKYEFNDRNYGYVAETYKSKSIKHRQWKSTEKITY